MGRREEAGTRICSVCAPASGPLGWTCSHGDGRALTGMDRRALTGMGALSLGRPGSRGWKCSRLEVSDLRRPLPVV